MVNLLVEGLGLVGGILILAAYFMLTHKELHPHSKTYQTMNLVGGILLAINTAIDHAYASAFINIAWSIIAIYGILKGLGMGSKKKKK